MSTDKAANVDTSTTSSTAIIKSEMKQRILVISRVVWEQVVEPWVLRPAIARRKTDRGLPRPVVSCVFATAEAMFPLVALASRAMLSSLAWGTRLCNSAHYRIVEDAASAPSPRCLAWIIARRIRSSSSPSHNVDWGEPSTGIGRAARLARKKAREQVAVLRGLCMGGHLVMAQRFVENGLECWPVDLAEREGDKSGETLQGGKRFWALGEETTSTKEDEDEDSEVEASVPGGTSKSPLDQGTALGDEFWSERGLLQTIQIVCKYGHLDVLKWLVSHFPLFNGGPKGHMQGCLHQASLNGHCHVLSWLLSTFIWTAEPSYSQMIQLDGKKCTVSGLKGLIDKFPNLHHRLVPSVAYSRAPEDEVLQLCQQVKNGFPSLGRQEFLSSKRMPKHTRVIQWALSDVTSEETLLNTKWNFSCQECGNVELGKWFIEEKGVTPAPKDFIAACSGRHDNVSFVEWLFKKVGDSLTSDQLLECLHRALANQSRNSIALWLEQLLMTSTGRMPKISLSKLVEFHNDPRDTWLEWVLTHSGSCDIDCSQEEVAKAVGYIVATLSSSHKSSVAISLWKKFNLSAALNHDLFCKLLVGILSYGTSFHFKYVASLGQLSPPELQQCMHAVLSDRSVTRVKAVKWLVDEINRGGGYVTEYEAGILLKRLIFNNKREAVQWLLNRDRIPLHYVLSHLDNPSCGGYVYLATWKVVLEMIPGITGDLIRQGHCVKVALKTPLHAQFTMSKLCLTHDDVERLCNNSEYSLPEIVDWLHHVVSTPRHSE